MRGLPKLLATAAIAAGALLILPASALAFGSISSFASAGSGAGQLILPGGIAVAPNGDSYVADYANNRIAEFSPTGVFVRAFGEHVDPAGPDVCTTATGCQTGTPSGAAGSMAHPNDLAIDAAGDVFVADLNLNRVDVFSGTGAFLRAFGEGVMNGDPQAQVCTATTTCQTGTIGSVAGAVNFPQGLDVDSSGKVYVAEGSNNRISVFSSDGTFERAFGKDVNPAGGDTCTTSCQASPSGTGAGALDQPFDVTVGPNGLLAVSEYSNNRISVFDNAGSFIRAFGDGVAGGAGYETCTSSCIAGAGTAIAGAVNNPTNSAVDGAGDLYVADNFHNRVSEYGFGGNFIGSFGEGVLDGGSTFQTCTTATGCQAGLQDSAPGATSAPFGVATDSCGAVYVVEEILTTFSRVERFGQPGMPSPPCSPPGSPASPPGPSQTQPPARKKCKAGFKLKKVHRKTKCVRKHRGKRR